MSLAQLATFFDDGQYTMVTGAQVPSTKFSTGQKIVQGTDELAFVLDLKIATEFQCAMHNLPGRMVARVENSVRPHQTMYLFTVSPTKT
jgi:hypothetical protein